MSMFTLDAHNLPLGDENAFLYYTEACLYRMQQLLRSKNGLEEVALLDVCEKIEELVYKKVLAETHPVPHEFLWMKQDSILAYQDRWYRILLNLSITCVNEHHSLNSRRENKEINWKKIYDDNLGNLPNLLNILLRDDLLMQGEKGGAKKRNNSIPMTSISSANIAGTSYGSMVTGAKGARAEPPTKKSKAAPAPKLPPAPKSTTKSSKKKGGIALANTSTAALAVVEPPAAEIPSIGSMGGFDDLGLGGLGGFGGLDDFDFTADFFDLGPLGGASIPAISEPSIPAVSGPELRRQELATMQQTVYLDTDRSALDEIGQW